MHHNLAWGCREMDALEAKHAALMSTALQRFAAVQSRFFENGLHVVSGLPNIPPSAFKKYIADSASDTAWKRVLTRGTSGIYSGTPTATTGTATTTTVAAPVRGVRSPPPPIPSTTGHVLYSYKAANPDEISLNAGEDVTVLEQNDDGWVKVRANDGRIGMYPANHMALNVVTKT